MILGPLPTSVKVEDILPALPMGVWRGSFVRRGIEVLRPCHEVQSSRPEDLDPENPRRAVAIPFCEEVFP